MTERYRLQRRLARGGMAEVYLAEAVGAGGFSKRVALKRVLPHLAGDDRVTRMFLAEAKLATHLHHQNIVQVFDVGQGPEGLFIAMEFVDGWDVEAIALTASEMGVPFPPPLAAYIATQVLAGLAHAYQPGADGKPLIAAHRDISPSNILISREGEVKVADFGIAKITAEKGLTDPGTFKGKLAYAAPEVLRGEPATPASDEFALGVTLYELIAGKHPFGDPGTPATFILALGTPAAPIAGLRDDYWNTLQRMLQKDPLQRLNDMDALTEAWVRLLPGGAGVASARALAAFLRALPLRSPAAPVAEPQTLPDLSLSNAAWLGAGIDAPEGWQPLGAQMDVSGRIVDGTEPTLPGTSRVGPLPPPVPAPASHDEPLELAYDPSVRPPEPEAPKPPPSPRRVFGLLAVLALIAVGVAGAVLAPRWTRLVPLPRVASGAHTLHVASEPSGALVRVNGTSLGETPLFLDNIYPPGEIRIELTLRGYKAWTGTFRGGEDARVEAQLRR